MIRNEKINVLNALNVRKVSFPAEHFTYVLINKTSPNILSLIDEWIYNNLNGRYYSGTTISLVNNSIVYVSKFGFETEKEVSFFKIACPYL